MTYQIIYRPNGIENRSGEMVMFDIEYYLKEFENKLWYSEISCVPIIKGLTCFFKDRFKDENFNHIEFMEDATHIQEIRADLYEKNDNKPKVFDDARNFHYKVFGNHLTEKLRWFAEKYGLVINVD